MNSSRRRARTLERGIEWLPRHDSHYILAGMMVSARSAPPICILQDTLRKLDDHLRDSPDFAFGLLAGSLCTCRESGRNYTLIDGFVPCEFPDNPAGDDPYGLIALALRKQIVVLERTGSSALGFYLCNTTVLPQVALEDVGLFRAVFAQPWNMMLIRDQGPDGDLGAFIRVEAVDDRPFAAPFTELIPDRGRRHRGEVPPSVVRWVNYQPTEPVASASEPGALPPMAARNGRSVRNVTELLPEGVGLGLDRISKVLSPWVASTAAAWRRISAELSDGGGHSAFGGATPSTDPAKEAPSPEHGWNAPAANEFKLPKIAPGPPSTRDGSEPAPPQQAPGAVAEGLDIEAFPASGGDADGPPGPPAPPELKPTISTIERAGAAPADPLERVPRNVRAPHADASVVASEGGTNLSTAQEAQIASGAALGERSEPAVRATSKVEVRRADRRASPKDSSREMAREQSDVGPESRVNRAQSARMAERASAENRSQLFEVLMMPPGEEGGKEEAPSNWQRYLGIGAVILVGIIAVSAIYVIWM